VNSGAYRIINGTCAHTDTSTSTLAQNGKCPELRNIEIPCDYNSAPNALAWTFVFLVSFLPRILSSFGGLHFTQNS